MSTGHTATCRGYGNEVELNGLGNCLDCQQLFDRMSSDLKSEEISLDDLVAAIENAADSDQIFDIFDKAAPPIGVMAQQRARERLIRAMRGKVEAAAKIVDAWLRRADDNGGKMVASQATELTPVGGAPQGRGASQKPSAVPTLTRCADVATYRIPCRRCGWG